MPKPRINEVITARHFVWKLRIRHGVFYADGRANRVNVGRHSLGTRDREEALKLLHDLDHSVAVQHGIAPASPASNGEAQRLRLEDGRTLYEEYLRRPHVAGGVRTSTFKRYKAVFDKFIPFAKSKRVDHWNGVTTHVLNSYATHLENLEYYGKTIRNELTTLVQAFKWLLKEKHLVGVERLRLELRKVESLRAYCYRPVEVEAMIKHCQATKGIEWLADVIVALACTGLRIAELAGMRWSDVNTSTGLLTLTDESGRGRKANESRRQLKSGEGRGIPIHPELAEVFKRLPRIDRYVFHGPRGGRIKPDTIRNILVRNVIKPLTPTFRNETAEQSFEHGRLHSFRHYFASMCANRGVPERIVMEWLGHKDSEMVRHYYHLHDDESRQQMAKLDLLGSKTGEQSPGTENGTAKSEPEVRPSQKDKPKKRGKGR